MATRQKQVFPRDTVAHLWAHKAQDSARDPSGNFYFTGPTIYSYGPHFAMAHILADECGPELAGRVLWNDAKSSNTTSKHKSIAWRALTRQQREDALHMPQSIGMGNVIDPHRIERALIEKRLPDISELILNRVSECVRALIGKRYGSGPFENLLSEARKAEKLALLFYGRVKKKYPLPLIETRPTNSDKTQWSAWIKSVSARKMKADYVEAVKQANHYAQQARKNAANCTDGFPYFKHNEGCEWEARNIVGGTYDAAQKTLRYIETAIDLYLILNPGKKPAAMVKLQKEMQPIAATFQARRDEFTKAETRNRVIYLIREAAKDLHRSKVKKQPLRDRVYSDMATLETRAIESGLTHSLYLPLASRFSRIGAAQSVWAALRAAENSLSVAQSYVSGGHHGDTVRHASDAIAKIGYIGRLNIATGLRAAMHAQNANIFNTARELRDSAQSAIVAREADKLRAWLAGESNVRPPFNAGTYARINGACVETTRGATVPIEHACRLSRMYAIAVRRGGNTWPDGSGPIVGHYRVNHIGADGSLIIGCHEFTPSEAKRLHALLEACEACATVAA
jgi:hypothetical protein